MRIYQYTATQICCSLKQFSEEKKEKTERWTTIVEQFLAAENNSIRNTTDINHKFNAINNNHNWTNNRLFSTKTTNFFSEQLCSPGANWITEMIGRKADSTNFPPYCHPSVPQMHNRMDHGNSASKLALTTLLLLSNPLSRGLPPPPPAEPLLYRGAPAQIHNDRPTNHPPRNSTNTLNPAHSAIKAR